MVTSQLKKALLDWSFTFMHFSLNDLSRFAHLNGFSLAQISILMHLHYQGACEITQFSEMLTISRAASSQMIERLVQQGVVHRFESSQDRRVRLVDLTETGKKVVTESMYASAGWINELVSLIPDQEHTRYVNMLRILNESASQMDQKIDPPT